MIVIRDPDDAARIANPFIRQLAALRVQQLQSPDAPDEPDASPFFIVVEAGDTVEQLEQEIGLPILRGLFDDIPFDHSDFSPCFEFLEEHHDGNANTVYEAFYLASDSGAGAALFIPEIDGIERDLLAMCRAWATPPVNSL